MTMPTESFLPPATPARPFRCGVVVLAAGASTRMGQPKQLLDVGGQPMLVRTVDAVLGAPVWPVVVVLGASADLIRPTLARHPVLVVENEAWAEGMASSIRTGIATLQQFSRALDAAIITLCDQPGLTTMTLNRLMAAHPVGSVSIVASRYAGRQAAPALFPRSYFPTLANLTGEEGARGLLNGSTGQVHTVDMPELAFDVDTPADYAALRRPS